MGRISVPQDELVEALRTPMDNLIPNEKGIGLFGTHDFSIWSRSCELLRYLHEVCSRR